jgi:hypothetical protein
MAAKKNAKNFTKSAFRAKRSSRGVQFKRVFGIADSLSAAEFRVLAKR